MSARSSSSPRAASCTALAPRRSASCAARPAERLATQSRSTPRERRFRCGQLTHLARADEQDRPLLEVVEDPGGELGCSGRDRRRVLTDARLAAHALADVQRLAEEAVEDRTDGARVLGRLVRAPHLAEDLRLAGDEGVQPGRYAEEVKSRLLDPP